MRPLFRALVMAVGVASAASAEPQLTVLRSDESVLEVRWTLDRPDLAPVSAPSGTFRRPEIGGAVYLGAPGQADVPTVVKLVGIPEGPWPRVRVTSVVTATEIVADMAPAPEQVIEGSGPTARGAEIRRAERAGDSAPADWAAWLSESRIRGQRAVRLALHPYRYDAARRTLTWAKEMVVRVEFAPGAPRLAAGAARAEPAAWEAAARDLLLNADVARAWRAPRAAGAGLRGAGPGFHSAPTWIRVPIRDAGVYRLDYYTLANAGVDPGGVDPRTIRVFAGRNLPIAENLLLSPPADFMTECALLDLGDGDGVFDTSDLFLLYALGPSGWGAEFDSTRSRTEYVENKHADETWYWIAWGGSFPDAPRRMAARSVPDSTATQWPDHAPDRVHFEQNNTENFNLRDEDGWLWEDLRGRGDRRRYTLNLDNPASGDGFVTARLYSHGSTSGLSTRAVELSIGSTVTAQWIWAHGNQTATQSVTGCFEGAAVPGPNDFFVDADLEAFPTSLDLIYTAWFDVEYDRRLAARNGWLKFFSAPAPPVLPTPPIGTGCASLPANLVYGSRAYRLLDFDALPSQIVLLDVTDPHAPVQLTDWTVQNAGAPHNIRFSDPGAAGLRWYVALTHAAAKPLPAGRIATLRGLRDTSNGTEYVVIYHPDFKEGAERLVALRNAHWGRDAAMAVDVEDVYQEFGWGMKDPGAIRDFLAYTLTSWANGAPLYVALVGDAVFDTKGYLSGSPPDLLPTWTERYAQNSVQYLDSDNVFFYSTDDYFGYLDADDYLPLTEPAMDMAVGRYPVSTPEMLDDMLDKLESYLGYEMAGQWQNRFLLVADDERVLDPNTREAVHTVDVETLARERVPPAVDRVKVYLVNYPRDAFSKKPEAQAAFIEEFTRGALMTTYTGHGDQNTMAQEEVFVSQKIPQLLNEQRYTVFSTFSCTVSRFDLISGSSMTELLLQYDQGGAVSTFASSGLVFSTPSATLNQVWLGEMFGTPYPIRTYTRDPRSLGLAALSAKAIVNVNGGLRRNNEKYVLLGDPALEVRFGRHPIDFDMETVDSLATDGLLRRISGAVVDSTGAPLDGTQGLPPFNGTAFIHVTENADSSGYDYTTASGADAHIDFVLEGSTAYRGEIPVVNGRFEAKFFLNEGVSPGNSARVSVFALEDGVGRDASGSYDSLVIGPTIAPSLVDDSEGPRIVVRFEGYDRFIDGDQIFTETPVVLITLEDPSGINLQPFPQFARLEAELDGRDRVDLREDFAYINGFTSGRVRRIFSLAPGDHTLEVKAFDNVNNRSTSTVRFTIVGPGSGFDLVDRNVGVYPNPFRHRADFLYRLTHDADVRLRLFTLSGRRIREIGASGVMGDNVLSWDGTDENGLPLANGTYLFKLEAERLDEEGNRESDDYVGKVVRMR